MATQLLTLDEAASRLRMTPKALRWLRYRGALPPAVKLGGRLYWREADIEAHITSSLEQAS